MSSPFADPNITDLLQGEHPEILARIGEGIEKSGLWHTNALISLKSCKTGPCLVLRSNRMSYFARLIGAKINDLR